MPADTALTFGDPGERRVVDFEVLPAATLRDQINSAVDLIVHQDRLKDGGRKITNITEVQGMEGDVIVLQDVFVFEQTGIIDGKVQGHLRPTGVRPRFAEKFAEMGISLSPRVFGAPEPIRTYR